MQGGAEIRSRSATMPIASQSTAPRLAFRSVSKRFGNFVAVDRVTLEIGAGEFFALLGPSGCGKSTLLRLAAGFERPDGGSILLDGEDVSRRPPHLRPLNMMFQSYALFPHLTVFGNVAFGLKQDGLARGEIAGRVAEMLALVQLQGLEARKPDQLSGGQRQRVALARALAKRPRVLLLDEPLAALDKKMRGETQAELAALQRKLGTTFVVVTHDQDEAMALADRLAVMQAGRLLQIGRPRDIYDRPNSLAVAGFIGSINLIPGRLAQLDGTGVLVDCGALGAFRAPGDRRYRVGEVVHLGVRPEKLRVARQRPMQAVNAVAGSVLRVDYLGDHSVYRVAAAGGLVLRASIANASPIAPGDVSAGACVWLTWSPESAIVLGE